MTEVVTRQEAEQALTTQLQNEATREQIRSALPEGVSLARFERAFLTAVQADENGDLLRADRGSLFRALSRCAMDGLLPNGTEAAIVVYKGKAGYLPMIDGIRKTAADYGWTIKTRVVREGEHYVYVEEPPSIEHRPELALENPDTRPIIAAYAVATHKDGRRVQRQLDRAEIEKRRKVAKTDAVWSKWLAQMCEKTVGHDVFSELTLGATDAERDRLKRMVVAFENDPRAAVEAIYGHPPVAGELPPATPRDGAEDVAEEGYALTPSVKAVGTAAEASVVGGDDEKVGGGTTEGPAAADSSAEPPLVEPEKTSTAFSVPDAAIDDAGGKTVTSNGVTKRIDEIADGWLEWALRNLEPGELRAAVELWVANRKPELWTAYQAELG